MNVVRDTHEATISREQFDAVQKILETTAQASKAKTVRPYTVNILQDYTIKVHALKSVARSIGAEELPGLAARLKEFF